MTKPFKIELEEQELGQVIDGLEVRAESWRRTAEYLKNGEMPEDGFFIIEECSDEDEAMEIAADYGKIIEKFRVQRDSQARARAGWSAVDQKASGKVSLTTETFYIIVGESVLDGLQPTVMVSEGDMPFRHLLFSTEREAQMEIVDRMMTKLEEFISGERDFDDAVAVDEYVLEVVRREDWKLFPKDIAMPLGFDGW